MPLPRKGEDESEDEKEKDEDEESEKEVEKEKEDKKKNDKKKKGEGSPIFISFLFTVQEILDVLSLCQTCWERGWGVGEFSKVVFSTHSFSLCCSGYRTQCFPNSLTLNQLPPTTDNSSDFRNFSQIASAAGMHMTWLLHDLFS